MNDLQKYLDTSIAGTGDKVSMEGFVEFAGDFFRDLFKGKKPNFSQYTDHPNEVANVKRTYGSLQWVRGRRLVGGTVKLDSGSILQPGFEKQIADLKRKVDANTIKNIAIVKQLMAKAKPYVDFLSGDQWKSPEAVVKFRDSAADLSGKQRFSDVGVDVTINPAEVEALSAEGVVAMTNLVFELKDFLSNSNIFKASQWNDTYYNKGVRIFTDKDPRYAEFEKHYADDSKTLFALKGIAEDLTSFIYGVEYVYSAESDNGYRDISQYIRAIIRLIDASVK